MSLSLEEVKSKLYVGMTFQWIDALSKPIYKILKINDETVYLEVMEDRDRIRLKGEICTRGINNFIYLGYKEIKLLSNFKRSKYEFKMSRK